MKAESSFRPIRTGSNRREGLRQEREKARLRRGGGTLQLDALPTHLNSPDAKFNADGAVVLLVKFVPQKAIVEASLASTCFSS